VIALRTDVLGVGFDSLTAEEAAAAGMELLEHGRGAYIVTPNPEIVWMCRKDPALHAAIDAAALVLADGVGISIGAKILGRPLKARIPGIDFMSGLFPELAARGKRVFLLGAKPGVAQQAADRLAAQYPGLRFCGVHDGYFSEDGPVLEEINAASPDLLLVCLGAPKQEKWMHTHADALRVPLMMGLGGALDVYAGVVERAPVRWQKLGLEWLHRLLREPWRIKRMSRLPVFLFAVIWQRIRGR